MQDPTNFSSAEMQNAVEIPSSITVSLPSAVLITDFQKSINKYFCAQDNSIFITYQLGTLTRSNDTCSALLEHLFKQILRLDNTIKITDAQSVQRNTKIINAIISMISLLELNHISKNELIALMFGFLQKSL